MKQLEHQKSVGWFKLAEFIARGEKERALGIYKLLALSINDTAFTYQLEGDILLAFEDQQASAKYFQAAEHYLKQHNVAAAIGTLNHLVILTPENLQAWDLLTTLYIEHYLPKITIHLRNLVNNQQLTNAQKCVELAIVKHQQNNSSGELTNLLAEIAKLNTELHNFALQVIKP